jgi:mRNA-degrading endonuclease RelE of RelBE toxin-antitoxin system
LPAASPKEVKVDITERERLDKQARKQLVKKLDEMARQDLDGFPHQALRGSQFKGLCKLRAGDWRMIYKMGDGEILFITLGHRSDMYET